MIRTALPGKPQELTNYLNALRFLCAETVVITCPSFGMNSLQCEHMDISGLDPEDYDGLILPGGCDVNPACYHEQNAGCGILDDDLDALQFTAIDRFVKAGKPVFGICRGHQIINVYFGGSLFQDIKTAFRHAKHSIREPDKIHASMTVPGSWIAELYGDAFIHNSAHHQAVNHIGEGLVPDAWCPEDDIVEAMHHKTLPVFSVQWHPERLALDWKREDAVDGLKVLRFFLERCERRP